MKVSLVIRKNQPERSVNVLKSLSNPVRVKLLYGLAQNKSAIDAAKDAEITPSELKFHVHTLKVYGLLEDGPEGIRLTEKAIWLISYLEEVSEKLTTKEEVEVEYRCEECGQRKMRMDVYPDHAKIWCPSCWERGKRGVVAFVNLTGSDWRKTDLPALIREGTQLALEVFSVSVKKSTCIECGATVEYKERDDRLIGKCPCCLEQYSAPAGILGRS